MSFFAPSRAVTVAPSSLSSSSQARPSEDRRHDGRGRFNLALVHAANEDRLAELEATSEHYKRKAAELSVALKRLHKSFESVQHTNGQLQDELQRSKSESVPPAAIEELQRIIIQKDQQLQQLFGENAALKEENLYWKSQLEQLLNYPSVGQQPEDLSPHFSSSSAPFPRPSVSPAEQKGNSGDGEPPGGGREFKVEVAMKETRTMAVGTSDEVDLMLGHKVQGVQTTLLDVEALEKDVQQLRHLDIEREALLLSQQSKHEAEMEGWQRRYDRAQQERAQLADRERNVLAEEHVREVEGLQEHQRGLLEAKDREHSEELNKLKAEFQQQFAQYQHETEARVRGMNRTHDDTTQRNEALTAELAKVQEHLATEKQRNAELLDQVAEQTARFQSVEGELLRHREEHRLELNKQRSVMEAALKEASGAQLDKLSSLETQLEHCKKEASEWKGKFDREVTTNSTKLAKLQEENTKLKLELTRLLEQRSKWEEDARRTEHERLYAMSQLQRAHAQIDGLEGELVQWREAAAVSATEENPVDSSSRTTIKEPKQRPAGPSSTPLTPGGSGETPSHYLRRTPTPAQQGDESAARSDLGLCSPKDNNTPHALAAARTSRSDGLMNSEGTGGAGGSSSKGLTVMERNREVWNMQSRMFQAKSAMDHLQQDSASLKQREGLLRQSPSAVSVGGEKENSAAGRGTVGSSRGAPPEGPAAVRYLSPPSKELQSLMTLLSSGDSNGITGSLAPSGRTAA